MHWKSVTSLQERGLEALIVCIVYILTEKGMLLYEEKEETLKLMK